MSFRRKRTTDWIDEEEEEQDEEERQSTGVSSYGYVPSEAEEAEPEQVVVRDEDCMWFVKVVLSGVSASELTWRNITYDHALSIRNALHYGGLSGAGGYISFEDDGIAGTGINPSYIAYYMFKRIEPPRKEDLDPPEATLLDSDTASVGRKR